MKKLSLLLALMLVLTTGVLAACGEDEDTSKPSLNINTSTPAGNSSVADKGDSSVADSSVADSSVADSSAADSSTPVVDVPTTIEGVVISGNMDYTYPTNDAGTHGARTYIGKLTDGVIPATFDFQPEWFGLFNNIMAADGSSNAYDGYGEFSFDLGAAKALTGVKAYVGWSADYLPVELTAYVSNDGSTWTEVGAMSEMDKAINNTANGAGVYTYGIAIDGSYQFVKVKMTCPANTYWAFIGEIEIYAAE